MPTQTLNSPSVWTLPGEEWIYSLSHDDAYSKHFALDENFQIQMTGDVLASEKLLHLTNRRMLLISNAPPALRRLEQWDNEQLLTQIELEDVLEVHAKPYSLSDILIFSLTDGRKIQIGHHSSPAMHKLLEQVNIALGTRQPLVTFAYPGERVLYKSAPLTYDQARIDKFPWQRTFPPLDPQYATLPRARFCITNRRIMFYYVHAAYHYMEGRVSLQTPWLRWMEAPLQEVQAVNLHSGLGGSQVEFTLARGMGERTVQGCTLPETMGGQLLANTSTFRVELKPGLAAAVQMAFPTQIDQKLKETNEPPQGFSCAPLRAQANWPAAPTELRAMNLQDLKQVANVMLGGQPAGQPPAPQPTLQPVAQPVQQSIPQPTPQPVPQPISQSYTPPQPTAKPRGEGCLPGLRKTLAFRLGVLLVGILSLGGCSIPFLISSIPEAQQYTTSAEKVGYLFIPVVFTLLSLALIVLGIWINTKKRP